MNLAARPALSRERIIAAAMAFIDENGLEALSMRKLGATLGVEAMSLYNHVDNKDEVLDGILDLVLRDVALPDQSLPWDDQLRELARSFRQAGLAHPGVLPMFGTRAIRSIEGFTPLVCAFGILRDVGLDERTALEAFVSLSSFVLGFVVIDMGGMREAAAGRSTDFSVISPQEHPRLAEMGAAILRGESAVQFERGLDIVLAGIARLLPASPPTTRSGQPSTPPGAP